MNSIYWNTIFEIETHIIVELLIFSQINIILILQTNNQNLKDKIFLNWTKQWKYWYIYFNYLTKSISLLTNKHSKYLDI